MIMKLLTSLSIILLLFTYTLVFSYVSGSVGFENSEEVTSIMLGNNVWSGTCQAHCHGFGKIKKEKATYKNGFRSGKRCAQVL